MGQKLEIWVWVSGFWKLFGASWIMVLQIFERTLDNAINLTKMKKKTCSNLQKNNFQHPKIQYSCTRSVTNTILTPFLWFFFWNCSTDLKYLAAEDDDEDDDDHEGSNDPMLVALIMFYERNSFFLWNFT